MKKIILLSLLGSLALALNAQSLYTFVGGGANTNWGNAANWTCSGTCPDGSGLVAPALTSGDMVVIANTCNVNGGRNIPAGVTMTVNSGITLTIAGNLIIDGSLVNEGDIINNGIFRTKGSTTNNGIITNNATMTVTNIGTFTNAGTINNNAVLTNNNDLINTSSGTINNNSGATINNGSNGGDQLINNGTINSASDADINNTGSIDNQGSITYNPATFTGNGITGTGTLPITLLRFHPYKDGNTVVVKWVTASEKENAYMEVQRSRDGIHFISIHEEKGHGTTSQQQDYEWTDTKPMSGVNYYRLKQVDFDSNATFHQIESVDFDGKTADSGIYLYPTEVQNQLTIMLDTPTRDDQSTLLIVDMLGRIMQQHRLSRDAVQQDVQVGNLPQGQYFITLQSGKTLQTARFVKL